MTQVENLWGNISSVPDMDSPKAILKQQAKYLSDMTKNVLIGEVRMNTTNPVANEPHFGIHTTSKLSKDAANKKKNDFFQYELLIKAPTLSYQFVLLSIQHDLTNYYPIILIDELTNKKQEISNAISFKLALSTILKSPSTQRALNTLLSQSV